ncbi:anhydro-N-acetylmuramic acid kinase [Achromobacter xylosoxidans]|uniref:anhydro-N-acetylmuramic acid kinase n=1 Tax=Alcaligenes xylosoxydans xylosoxydans TaxID=85698 RepID=UPI002368651A|nr:anhydro-N-acetylmuramic acid kinase [Achromobacter xylosoxidans]MDD7990709.1 anhydro-N-acetylmuramic acid kinase [Achromobacter xylosoxidans]
MTTPQHFIGLMSGTSVDGVDGVLARLRDGQPPQVLASASLSMPAALRAEFLALNLAGDDELARAALAANELARLYAQVVADLLAGAKLQARDVAAIGAHGQTVRHRPDSGYTVQLNAPALLAELTGIDVVADFRSRDVAAGGQVLAPLLEQLIASEPWFALPPPKSTGRDLFNMRWLDDRLAAYDGPRPAPQDVQATLQRLTARTVANAIDAAGTDVRELYVCGGGACNPGLMRELAYCLQRPVHATDALGVPAQQVEALAFAWLAQAFLARRPAGLPGVTGARGARILGALYPA